MAEIEEKKAIIGGLHYLLSELHMALATNKLPNPEVMQIVENLEEWYETHKGRNNDS